MRDERDRELLEAVELIGPVTPKALEFHSVERRFETADELAERLDALAHQGHLRRRTVVDVSGARITEYDTVD